ncbi:MAG: hypothetical protein ABIQ27_10515 [Flavobacterium sp.]|uniref:hypothetical protein n=1 Tax=Flavobacterium sp. TaxID=239 RepID=UPI003262DABC
MITKYIIIERNHSVIVFEKSLLHSEVAKPFGTIKSAGFCNVSIKNNTLEIKCFGASSTLKIDSNPTVDEALIRDFLFIKAPKEVLITI